MKNRISKLYKKFKIWLTFKIKNIQRYIEFRGEQFLINIFIKILKIICCGVLAELSFFGLQVLADPLKYMNYPIMNLLDEAEIMGYLVVIIMFISYIIGAIRNYYYWKNDDDIFHSDILLIATEDITDERGYVMYQAGERICTGTLNMSCFHSLKGSFEITESNRNGYYTVINREGDKNDKF